MSEINVEPKSQHYIYLLTEGFRKPVPRCRKPEAVDRLKTMKATMPNSNLLSIDQSNFNLMLKYFEGPKVQTQFYVILHKINMYFHNWKLATKWNKIFHKNSRIS